MYSRFFKWLGLASIALATPRVAPAQLIPFWTVNYGQVVPGVARGDYYSNTNLAGSIFFSADTPTINFDWGFGSPAGGFPADRFSVRWTGTIVPQADEPYTFFATSDDGCRIWLNDQLILDRWFDQGPTEWESTQVHLTAGSLYKLRVEYYENTGGSLIRVYWKGLSQPKQLVTFQDAPDGIWANFGAVLSGIGDGRFAVAAPRDEVQLNVSANTYVQDGGFAWFYDQSGQKLGFLSAPTNTLRREYGRALAAFPDGRVLDGTANSATGPSGTITRVGSVFLHGPGGEALGEWPNPDGAVNGAEFGRAIVALPGNRFAASSSSGQGKVFIFDASQPAPPLVVITNPAPPSAFGISLAALGNRLLVGDIYDNQVPGRPGSVRIYDLSGNLIRTIRNPVELDSSGFGQTLAAVDDHRFLVGAPTADAVYFPVGLPATNQTAGAVYLFDDTGGLVRTFTGPNAERSGFFGTSIAMLDAGRAIIGSPYDLLGNVAAGRASRPPRFSIH